MVLQRQESCASFADAGNISSMGAKNMLPSTQLAFDISLCHWKVHLLALNKYMAQGSVFYLRQIISGFIDDISYSLSAFSIHSNLVQFFFIFKGAGRRDWWNYLWFSVTRIGKGSKGSPGGEAGKRYESCRFRHYLKQRKFLYLLEADIANWVNWHVVTSFRSW